MVSLSSYVCSIPVSPVSSGKFLLLYFTFGHCLNQDWLQIICTLHCTELQDTVFQYRCTGAVYHINRNRKLEISTAPTKAKSREPVYSQALIQNKINRQRVRSRESDRQSTIARRLWWMVFGVKTGREVGRRGWIRIGFVEKQGFKFGLKDCGEIARGEVLVSS